MYIKCPVCGSSELRIEYHELMGKYVTCTSCGFDESKEYDEGYGEEKTPGKGKGGSVYKRGGPGRTQKSRK